MTPNPKDQKCKPDFIEVSRVAHQLGSSHGKDAYLYALRLAEQAKDIEDLESEHFWRTVYAALRPR